MGVTVSVFLNRQKDEQGRLVAWSRFGDRKYQDGDDLEHVLDLDVGMDDPLNETFRRLNRGSGEFVGDDVYPQRSLSIGDVLEVLGTRWSVESVGFERVFDRRSDDRLLCGTPEERQARAYGDTTGEAMGR